MNKKILKIILLSVILLWGFTTISAHGVDVTNDKMVIANDTNGQEVKDIADSNGLNISVYKFTSDDEVAHQLEHMLNNSNKHILVVSYQDTAEEFLAQHQDVSDRLIILREYDEKSLAENMEKIINTENSSDNQISNWLIISAIVLVLMLTVGVILFIKNKK